MGKHPQTAVYTDVHTETRSLSKSGLTGRQESFARAYAECGIALDAYRAAYECDGSSRATARVNAYRLLKIPKVAARIRELQQAAAERSCRSAAELICELEAMVSADLNELMQLVVGSCRCCHGHGHKYQWRDEAEYIDACVTALDSQEPPPSDAGGFGYVFDRESHPECPHCNGGGMQRVRMTNTADLSPGVRRLFRGIELFEDGRVKRILLHDQMAARIELHRLMGLHVERSISLNAKVNLPALKDLTPEQALDFLESLRPTTSPALPVSAPVDMMP